jgi:hypothetical protein
LRSVHSTARRRTRLHPQSVHAGPQAHHFLVELERLVRQCDVVLSRKGVHGRGERDDRFPQAAERSLESGAEVDGRYRGLGLRNWAGVRGVRGVGERMEVGGCEEVGDVRGRLVMWSSTVSSVMLCSVFGLARRLVVGSWREIRGKDVGAGGCWWDGRGERIDRERRGCLVQAESAQY